MAGSGADAIANSILGILTTGVSFTVPAVDLSEAQFSQPATTGELYATIDPIDLDELTTGTVGGDGVFDKLMVSLTAHLQVEFEAARISGAEYTKAYLGVVQAALAAAQQFVLGKSQAYWSAVLVRAQAQAANIAATTARVELEGARINIIRAQYESETARVNYGLTKIKIAVEDATYSNLTLQGNGIEFTNENILPKQATLVAEQGEAARAQTMNTRSDNATTVVGVLGKQKDLYTQQIASYQRDSEQKVAKIFSDAWITQKTIDEGLTAPSQFNNANVDAVLTKIRASHNLT